MTGILSLEQAAVHLHGIAPATLRRFAADRQRDPRERRYPEHLHERFPVFVKDEAGHWVISEQSLRAHLARRLQKLEPEV